MEKSTALDFLKHTPACQVWPIFWYKMVNDSLAKENKSKIVDKVLERRQVERICATFQGNRFSRLRITKGIENCETNTRNGRLIKVQLNCCFATKTNATQQQLNFDGILYQLRGHSNSSQKPCETNRISFTQSLLPLLETNESSNSQTSVYTKFHLKPRVWLLHPTHPPHPPTDFVHFSGLLWTFTCNGPLTSEFFHSRSFLDLNLMNRPKSYFRQKSSFNPAVMHSSFWVMYNNDASFGLWCKQQPVQPNNNDQAEVSKRNEKKKRRPGIFHWSWDSEERLDGHNKHPLKKKMLYI